MGTPIDLALRRSLLHQVSDVVDIEDLWIQYARGFGCVDALDVANRIGSRYGPPVGDEFRERLERALATVDRGYRSPFNPPPDELPAMLRETGAQTAAWHALCALPDEEFLMAMECAIDFCVAPSRDQTTLARHINRVFGTVGVAYRFGPVPMVGSGPRPIEFYRLLDPGFENRVIRPALRALTDPRLVTAAKEFGDGLRRVAKVGAGELDDAVLDFGRAVQEALHALADATCGNAVGGTAGALFGALRKAGVLPEESESLVLGATKLRNSVEHQRGVPRTTDERTAQAALGAAATAIAYVASFLPAASPVTASVTAAPADDDIPF